MLTKIVNKLERSALLKSQRIYSITLASNHAMHKNAYRAYKYTIKQFPTGIFNYIHEKSENGKYHIHGIMTFQYRFDHHLLMSSRKTEEGRQFDIHIQYQLISTNDDYLNWYNYSSKHNPQWKQCVTPKQVGSIPFTCIPQATIITLEKEITIPGL